MEVMTWATGDAVYMIAPSRGRNRSGETSERSEAPAAHSPPIPRLATTRQRTNVGSVEHAAHAAVPPP